MPLAAPGPEWSLNRSEDPAGTVVPVPAGKPLFSLIDDDGTSRPPAPVHFLPCDCVVRGDTATDIRRLIKQVRATLAGLESESK